MLDLLLFPFRLAIDLIGAAFDIIFGLVDLVFGLIGGLFSLCLSLIALGLVIGLLVWFFQGKKGEKKPDDEEEFTSFYHQE